MSRANGADTNIFSTSQDGVLATNQFSPAIVSDMFTQGDLADMAKDNVPIEPSNLELTNDFSSYGLQQQVYNTASVRASRSSNALAFVPNVVDAFAEYDRAQVHQALLQLDHEGAIELRPDSGLARFTSTELDACPDGPNGSKLLWIRICVPIFDEDNLIA